MDHPAMTEEEMRADRTRRLVTRFYERLWNAWDDEAVDGTLADDFEFRGSLGDRTASRDAWRRYRDRIREGSQDFRNEVRELIVSGDRAAVRLRYTGTHSGRLLGIEPTGRRFTYAGAAFFLASEDRLASAWVLGDLAGLRAQLEGSAAGRER
ncbi:MAG: ester cyclase [Candidatus Dormibacteraceae bacterium]